MGDPFSVAASAVGVVALGIQICQGLLSYYDDFKSFDSTIDSLCQKIENLRATFEICEELLNTSGNAMSKGHSNVIKNMDACRNDLGLLKKALDSCRKHPKPRQYWKHIPGRGQQILFPFRKAHVQRLHSTVLTLQENVHLALLALQMWRISELPEFHHTHLADNVITGKALWITQRP